MRKGKPEKAIFFAILCCVCLCLTAGLHVKAEELQKETGVETMSAETGSLEESVGEETSNSQQKKTTIADGQTASTDAPDTVQNAASNGDNGSSVMLLMAGMMILIIGVVIAVIASVVASVVSAGEV